MLLLFDNQPHQAGKLGGLEHGDDSALELGAFNRHDKPGQFAGAQVDSLKRRFKKAGADKLVIVKDGVFQLALGKRSGIEIAVTHYNACILDSSKFTKLRLLSEIDTSFIRHSRRFAPTALQLFISQREK